MSAVSLTRKHLEKLFLPILTAVRETEDYPDLTFAEIEAAFTPHLSEDEIMTANGWIWFMGRALAMESREAGADTIKVWRHFGDLIVVDISDDGEPCYISKRSAPIGYLMAAAAIAKRGDAA